jgi:ribosomal protein S18 acetylase RimI-like enzyme
VGVDPSQWFVAELDGEPVGFVLGDASRAPDGGGYVRTLGVLPAVRGRGIARHLLEVVFAEQARRGWTWTQLTVDSGNPTGAPGLYGSVGMSAVEVIDVYRAGFPEPTGLAAPSSRSS